MLGLELLEDTGRPGCGLRFGIRSGHGTAMIRPRASLRGQGTSPFATARSWRCASRECKAAVAEQGLTSLRSEAFDLLADLVSEEGQEMLGQREPVRSRSQRGQGQLHDIQAKQQVLTELAGGDGRIEVAIGRRHEPDVGRARAGFADPFVAAFLEEPEQLGLEGQREVADLVEEERPTLGGGDRLPPVSATAPVKEPPRVAEQGGTFQ